MLGWYGAAVEGAAEWTNRAVRARAYLAGASVEQSVPADGNRRDPVLHVPGGGVGARGQNHRVLNGESPAVVRGEGLCIDDALSLGEGGSLARLNPLGHAHGQRAEEVGRWAGDDAAMRRRVWRDDPYFSEPVGNAKAGQRLNGLAGGVLYQRRKAESSL